MPDVVTAADVLTATDVVNAADVVTAADVAVDSGRVDAPALSDVVDAARPSDVPTVLDVPAVTPDVPVVPADVPADVCVPRCTGRVCGDDGCGGTCAPGCAAGQTCTTSTGLCAVRDAVWTGRSPSASPTGRNRAAMAYDSARGRTVLFGGDSRSATYDATTWEYQVPATP